MISSCRKEFRVLGEILCYLENNWIQDVLYVQIRTRGVVVREDAVVHTTGRKPGHFIIARIRKLELEHCFNLFLVYLCVCMDVAVCVHCL